MDINKLKGELLKTPSKEKWLRIGAKKRSGILIGLFSVYSKKSIGIADFNDLKLLIDFCRITGNSILQLLPMNEVGATNCPYDSISSFALEPQYLCLEQIDFSADNSGGKKLFNSKINDLKKQFPVGENRVNYQIKQAKLDLLWDFFSKGDFINEKNLEEFISDNNYWIIDFALYKVLKKYHKGKAWYDWAGEFKSKEKTALDSFKKTYQKEILFEIWLQYNCYKQFRLAKDYASSKNILLKGDLPVLVSRDSADVWKRNDFFKLEFAAGAPPDMYEASGQRWGMPTYNWENIAKDNFRYLKEKLKYAENFYDILRIDHVVGLFRIWSIPYNEPEETKGLNGFFDPKDESLWEEHGRNILTTIVNNTSMLICAEDLGVIPAACPKIMDELGICGNDVSRWTKDWQTIHDFLEPNQYRSLAVSMLSTHDTTNFSAWYEFEAGTVDEKLFIRKCKGRGINFDDVKSKLFNLKLSKYGRLRWLDEINSVDLLLWNLGKPKNELFDFIDLYENTYKEKEKFIKKIGLSGKIRENCDYEIVEKALSFVLNSNSIFSIQLLVDWFYLSDIFKGDPYYYRINTPGTISNNNWSLVLPLPLEEVIKHKVSKTINKLIKQTSRS